MKPPEFNNYSPSTRRYLRKNPNATLQEIQCKEEAASFARSVLMPEKQVINLFNEMIKIYSFTKYLTFRSEIIKDMAKIFNVEVDEMRYRLRELKLYY